MKRNKTYPLGGIVMIEKIEKTYDLFEKLFKGIEGKMKDFIPIVKLHINNKLTYTVSTHQILNTYPEELIYRLGVKEKLSEKKLYRTLKRIGKYFPILHERYQNFLKENDLIDKEQFIDFSSTYVEGEKIELAKYGYSRDKRSDKKQVNFGISTGINNIPTAITIQKGNTQDKKHMKEMLKIVLNVFIKNSLLIFDAGANTKENKEKIRKTGHHYLTFKPKKVGIYKKHIKYFYENLNKNQVKHFEINNRNYVCVKKKDGTNILYIIFSPKLYEDQIMAKERKFERNKEKGNKLLKKRKYERFPSDNGWVDLIPKLQKILFEIDNPYINGVEGFFILESSIDDEPQKILRLYKDRDKAEKFIRNLKEGIELRPIRHWNKWCIIGIFFICFLANFLINLTLFLSKSSKLKNVKLLKKSLINLSLTIAYPKNRFRFSILSNVTQEILDIFGDFVWKFDDKSLNLRW
jgi:transposase